MPKEGFIMKRNCVKLYLATIYVGLKNFNCIDISMLPDQN